MYAMNARITRASHGSTRAMPAWPKIARHTTNSWHRTENRIGLEKPVACSTTKLTVTPASIACTQLHPIRITTFAATGRNEPRSPKDPLVSDMVGSPVRVPILPTRTRTAPPMTVPRMISPTARGQDTPGTKSVPVSSVVTTRLAASQIMPIRPAPRVPLMGPKPSEFFSRWSDSRENAEPDECPVVGDVVMALPGFGGVGEG